jgi:hypothetical protein
MKMSIVTRINKDDECRQIELATGEILQLRFDADCVSIYYANEEIGRLTFMLHDEPVSPGEDQTVARLTHAFLEGAGGRYKRQGVGTEAVRFFLECTGYILELPKNDGVQKEDGSHLVGDRPAFVASLEVTRALDKL